MLPLLPILPVVASTTQKALLRGKRIFIKAGVRLLQHHHLPILCSSWSQNDFSCFFLPATNCRMGESLPRHQHPLFKWLLGDWDFGRPCEDKGLEHSWSTNRQFFYWEWYHHQVISGAHYSFHIFFRASAIHIGYPVVWNTIRLPPPTGRLASRWVGGGEKMRRTFQTRYPVKGG